MKPSPDKFLIPRLFVALAAGICVAWLTLHFVANAFYFLDFNAEQQKTQSSLKRVARVVEAEKKSKGFYPQNLDNLLPAGLDDKDGWGNAWSYSLPNGKPLIESLGRDSKRGGFEQDGDLSNINPSPDAARLPRWKRLIQPIALVPSLICIVAGALAGGAIFVRSQKSPARAREYLPVLASVVITCLIAIFGAVFIAIAHIPSGH